MTSLHPGILLMVSGGLCALLPKGWGRYCGVAGALAAVVSALTLGRGDLLVLPFVGGIQLHLLFVDSLSWLFTIFFAFLALLGSIYAFHNDSRAEQLASLSYAGSTIGMVLAGDWISLIFFWELMAVSSLYLVWAGGTAASRKAGMRYLLVHMLGGNLLLAGILFQAASGKLLLSSLTGTQGAAFWLILLGICVNGVVPPFHFWAADAYPESSITGGVFLSALTTKAAVYLLIRLYAGTDWLLWVGVFMALYGAVYAILENDMRRLLSYHIVSQLGFMVAGVGIGSSLALDGAAAHAVTNVLQKSALFMGAGAVMRATGCRKLNQLGGLGKRMPLTCTCFLAAGLSIAGLPLFNGFVAKSMTITAAADAGLPAAELLLTLAGIGTFLSICLKMAYYMFFAPAQQPERELKRLPVNMCAAMVLAAAGNTVLGLAPSLLHSRLPNESIYHAYTVDHVTQYIQLLGAAAIPFLLYLSHMMPRSALNLDVDWLLRKPFATAVDWTSRMCCIVRDSLGGQMGELVKAVEKLGENPVRYLQETVSGTRPMYYDPDEYRPQLGDVILDSVLLLSGMLLIFWTAL